MNKPVVFIGGYDMSEHITSLISVSDSSPLGKLIDRLAKDADSAAKAKHKYDYIGWSYINWSITNSFDYDEPEAELYKLCDYLGVDFKHCTREQYNEARKNYSSIDPYPSKDCIVETDDYIVVKLK